MTLTLSPAQLLDRCNEIRRIGGAETLDELLPGVQGNGHECLIARNLNFDCVVGSQYISSADPRLATVAAQLGWPLMWPAISDPNGRACYSLPSELRRAVSDFDNLYYPDELYAEPDSKP